MLSASVTLRRWEYHEALRLTIEVGVLVVQLRHRFVDPNRHSEWVSDAPWRGRRESTTGPADGERRGGGRT